MFPSLHNLSEQKDSDCTLLHEINLFQLWEESQAENTKLRLQMSGIKHDLDSAKHQLEVAIQVYPVLIQL